jgi:ABC-type transport system involved in multi-copper enzyme maturation permease subunit
VRGRLLKSLLYLTWAEFLQLLHAPYTLYFYLGLIGFLGFVFWLLSTWMVAAFLDFVYLFLPLFFLALATPQISRDRESGFSSILFTHPISKGEYYIAKFLSLHLVLAIYLLTLVPFNAVIILYGGAGWLAEILRRIVWAFIETAFAVALGLFISAAMGRRATVPSVSLGFVVALSLAFGPFLAFQYFNALDPSFLPIALGLLHISPLTAAMDSLGSHGLALNEPLGPVLLSGFLIPFLFLAGVQIYRRLQSPEGWELTSIKRVAVVGAVLAILLGSSLVPDFEYTIPQISGSNCTTWRELEYCMFSIGIGPEGPMVGSSIDTVIRVSIFNPNIAPSVIPFMSLRWHSEYVSFNRTSADFVSILVPAAHDPDPSVSESVRIDIPVRISILRSRVLGSPPFGSTVPYILTIELSDFEFSIQGFIPVTAPPYNRDTAWGVVGGIVAIALTLWVVGMVRRRV